MQLLCEGLGGGIEDSVRGVCAAAVRRSSPLSKGPAVLLQEERLHLPELLCLRPPLYLPPQTQTHTILAQSPWPPWRWLPICLWGVSCCFFEVVRKEGWERGLFPLSVALTADVSMAMERG